MLDRFACYELCVQSPRHVVGMLRAIAGPGAMRLREDFCGTAAVSRWWVRREGASALGVDVDGEVLKKAVECEGRVGSESRPALEFMCGDLLTAEISVRADVVFVGNFSIGYFFDRRGLVRYLERSRCALGSSGGVFVCDTYGGASAFALGSTTRKIPGPDGTIVHYHWSHDAADPLTGMVENSISFRVEAGGEIVQEMPRAFVYRWRLWSIAELREAMVEAGFLRTAVFAEVVGEGVDGNIGEIEPVKAPNELGSDWVVMVAGWTI